MYLLTAKALETEQKKFTKMKFESGRNDPQLELEFGHTEDDILTKMSEKRSILRRIDDMYGRTLTDIARNSITKWEQELRELLKKLEDINIRYSL